MPKGIKGSKAKVINPHQKMLDKVDKVVYTHMEGIFAKQLKDGTFKDAKDPYILVAYAKFLRSAPKQIDIGEDIALKTDSGRVLSDEELLLQIKIAEEEEKTNKKSPNSKRLQKELELEQEAQESDE